MFKVEFRSEDGWGHFSAHQFDTEEQAIRFASLGIKKRVGYASIPTNPLIAARVWLPRRSDIGDRVVWDSRD
jgi:hypothetical protein